MPINTHLTILCSFRFFRFKHFEDKTDVRLGTFRHDIDIPIVTFDNDGKIHRDYRDYPGKRNWLVKRNPYNYSCRMCYSGVSAYTALKWKFIKFQQAAIVSLGLGPGNE